MSDKVLAVDPGEVTGFILFDLFTLKSVVEGQMNHMDFLTFAEGLLAGSRADVVCEDFIVTSETAKKTRTTASLEQIGALRYFAYRQGSKFVLQSPSQAKSFATDDKLKIMGWYVPGKGHLNDALRHLLVYCVNVGAVKPALLLTKDE